VDPVTYEVDSFYSVVYAVSVAVPDPPVQHQQILTQIAINRNPNEQSSFFIRNLLYNPYNIYILFRLSTFSSYYEEAS
jgi:hypothetical protein